MSRPGFDVRFFRNTSKALTQGSFLQRRASSRLRASIPSPYPVVDTCPSPTCECRPMPEGLDLDTKHPLNGTMASYAEQILICTGKDDWASKIDEDEVSHMARGLKEVLGRGGKFSDPYHNVMITNASFKPSTSTDSQPTSGSAYLFPSFKFLSDIPLDRDGLERFVRGFVLPEKLHRAHDVLSIEQKRNLVREPASRTGFTNARDVTDTIVLICGHGGRDARCGVMGPLLQAEFEDKFKRKGYKLVANSQHDVGRDTDGAALQARVGLISHIGGHKYAGNVIVYIPQAAQHALAGCGIWYGRVRPDHVEGIIQETLLSGRVVKDLFRGGIDSNGKPIML